MSALPVHCYCQKSAWIDRDIFSDWFHKHFVPLVKKYLADKSLSPRALLVLDNAPSHPTASTLASEDGDITCLFLPPNVTSIIQPMDQGILENLKRRYKRELLRKLLLHSEEDVSFMEFCKKLTIKSAVYLSAKFWEEISSTSLCRAWNKLFSGGEKLDNQPPSEELPLISEEFGQLEISECEMEEWLTADQDVMGFQELSDGEILDLSKNRHLHRMIQMKKKNRRSA